MLCYGHVSEKPEHAAPEKQFVAALYSSRDDRANARKPPKLSPELGWFRKYIMGFLPMITRTHITHHREHHRRLPLHSSSSQEAAPRTARAPAKSLSQSLSLSQVYTLQLQTSMASSVSSSESGAVCAMWPRLGFSMRKRL